MLATIVMTMISSYELEELFSRKKLPYHTNNKMSLFTFTFLYTSTHNSCQTKNKWIFPNSRVNICYLLILTLLKFKIIILSHR